MNAALALKKANGAYYTDEAVARFLTCWALPDEGLSILDPSCGDGVFLAEALGMRPPSRLVGVDIQASALAQAKGRLGGDHAELVNADFFSTTPDKLGRFDAVVGNPPFIRFHRFSGMSRARALGVAKAAGVKLTALSSAWAPFLVHAAQFVQPGGRLAMVAPMELLHAAYALPVLRYLCDCFARTVVLTFERRLFPDLSQDTVLVLGSCRAGQGRGLDLLSLKDPWQLETLLAVDPLLRAGRSLPVEPLVSGQQRALQYLLPDATRRLYVSLQAEGLSARLGEWLAVSIGYVTGNNSFFHFSAAKAEELGLETRNLRRVLRRAEEIRGLAYTESDWLAARAADAECYVLSLDAEDGVLPPAVSAYIREGERKGVHLAYKCAVRSPWYSVPGIGLPEAFVTYMVHTRLILAVNRARTSAPNSLLVARRKEGAPTADFMAVAMATSLAQLSAEIEGHSLGGGLLKLEPGEAAKLTLPAPGLTTRQVRRVFEEVDRMLRDGREAEAQEKADASLLQSGLGLSPRDCRRLRDGINVLRGRRLNR